MKIAVIGGSGFIGKHFIEEFGAQFDEVRCLLRKPSKELGTKIIQIKGSLNNKIAIEYLTKNIDVILHAGFDPLYQENLSGIYNVLEAISANKVSKLIYLSSYVVYDCVSHPILSELSPYSHVKDIYTVEKQKIEAILQEYAQQNTDVSIITLQPTIVYGLGGNWTTTFIKANKHHTIKLPNEGTTPCPLIYVKDVTKAMSDCIFVELNTVKNNYEKILLSSSEDVSWRNVYEIHGDFIKKIGKKSYTYSYEEAYLGDFGGTFVKNKLIQVLFSKSIGASFNSLLKAIKRWIYKRESLNEVLDLPVFVYPFEIVGLYKYLHKSNAMVDTGKAKEVLNFKPRFRFEDGVDDMVKNYIKPN
ncbi:MAG: NAD(P)-dependent oxidoreductase [Cytophagales bacterium]|nr:MAG: NAD(P)-dependent oxidoreductase [Cytophagales bacterium]